MLRPYPGMAPWLTTVVTLVDAAGRKPIQDLDLDGIAANRAAVHPRGRLAQRVLGAIDPSVTITTAVADGRGGTRIPLRLYRSGRSGPGAPVIFFYHGGGWVQGNVLNYDPLCADLAAGVGAFVVSVDYRLAPEHKAPAAADDCIDATRWLLARAEQYAVDASRVAVSGDSAGGNLAAVVTQAFRDAGADGIRAQALIYPAVDCTLASPSIDEHASAPILTRAGIHAFLGHYLDGSGVDPRDPIVSPLFGDLHNLPPALIQTADLDPIRDDGLRYAAALASAGIPVRVTNFQGAPHGFASLAGAYRGGEAHRRELVGFLTAALSAARAGVGG
ncbi:MAG TPA: alpha/beta hydrolase [Tetrasphaera sp.]|uniref:alpha/beta hydrolase n=1 Tax=Nostocoides sp. TaxID=1917966 RepID=UPI002C015B3B|nr:alpha/beta hydrolase [Tetrasphaera sp.]HNQ06792.1 alpha/beta hydrolase [Tetrasphaera sp.]